MQEGLISLCWKKSHTLGKKIQKAWTEALECIDDVFCLWPFDWWENKAVQCLCPQTHSSKCRANNAKAVGLNPMPATPNEHSLFCVEEFCLRKKKLYHILFEKLKAIVLNPRTTAFSWRFGTTAEFSRFSIEEHFKPCKGSCTFER